MASAGRFRRKSVPVKSRDDLQAGDMIIYPFLWGWEKGRGHTNAWKMRPCVVLSVFEKDGKKTAAILPITSADPLPHHRRHDIPYEECDRVSMDPEAGATIGLNDINFDAIETSNRIRHKVPMRQFSPEFMSGLLAAFIAAKNEVKVDVIAREPGDEKEPLAMQPA